LARHVARGSVAREDVAALVVAALDDERSAGHILEVVGGDTPIADALTAVVAAE
jgi:uncharacterized protein YbjT (DUF2867 family)